MLRRTLLGAVDGGSRLRPSASPSVLGASLCRSGGPALRRDPHCRRCVLGARASSSAPSRAGRLLLARRGVHASAPLRKEVSVRVPSAAAGDRVDEWLMTEWLAQEGAKVEEDEVICVLETDKVTVDIEAPCAGVLTKHVALANDKLAAGQHIGTIEST